MGARAWRGARYDAVDRWTPGGVRLAGGAGGLA